MKNTLNMLDGRNSQGFMAETMVMTELAKRGIYSIRLPSQFNYDLLCNNDVRIEVKSSTTKNKAWGLRIGKRYKVFKGRRWVRVDKPMKKTNCDFFVCVCFEKEVPYFFIIPSNFPNSVTTISIQRESESKYWKFEDKWDAIINFNNGRD